MMKKGKAKKKKKKLQRRRKWEAHKNKQFITIQKTC